MTALAAVAGFIAGVGLAVRVILARVRELEEWADRQAVQLGELARLAGAQREEIAAAHGALDRLGAPRSASLAARVSALWIGSRP